MQSMSQSNFKQKEISQILLNQISKHFDNQKRISKVWFFVPSKSPGLIGLIAVIQQSNLPRNTLQIRLTLWMQKLYGVETNSLQIYVSNLRILTSTQNFHFVKYIILKNLFHIARISVLIGFVPKIGFSIVDVFNLSAGLKTEVTMKKLLDNKFSNQGNLTGKIYLTKIPKLRGETNLSLILLTTQPIFETETYFIKY